MSEWATHQEELSRKVLTVLEDRVHKHLVEGLIDAQEMRWIADALYDTVSGLVPWEVADTIAQVQKELDK